MKNLVIDIGNSRIKSALFEGKDLIGDHSFEDFDAALRFWEAMDFQACLVSSVRFTQEELAEKISFPFVFLSHDSHLPILNGYSTPKTLGLDRIAAAIGAWDLAGKKSVLAIDLGSCITYEWVDELSIYRGGAISPGLQMRAKAMNSFTARLPLVALDQKPEDALGNSTVSCMQSGIWYGVEYELLGHIEAYRLKIPEIKVYICGGDSLSFESLAKDHIFVVPNLVLHGLNCILNHNVE
ncbi:type III pantothenate kinase [Algoriphagus litoralis]|uniref:type III pantothenate kinase n=1 Tax=Algoriphagus litoralis TaxID=2202829 RepID=UPI000DB996F2|nr:type III pantothenate kinase [Algoriphagus litoralis]